MTSSTTAAPRSALGFRIGRVVQVVGMIIGLEAMLVFGMETSEGPMVYVTILALIVFYSGHLLTRRFGPPKDKQRK